MSAQRMNLEMIESETLALLARDVPQLLALYRFGSAGGEFERPDSDVDLAFLARAAVPNLVRWQLAQQLAARLGRDVDLVDLARANTVLRLQVVTRGARFYCADENYVEAFEDRVLVSYARLNEERREILEDIRRRGRIYG